MAQLCEQAAPNMHVHTKKYVNTPTRSFELILAEFELPNESNEYSIVHHILLFGTFMYDYKISQRYKLLLNTNQLLSIIKFAVVVYMEKPNPNEKNI